MADLKTAYFDWVCGLIADERKKLQYSRLLSYLFERDFYEIIPMDANRAEDGMNLRYDFANDLHLNHAEACSILDIRPCSILEMMVALARRCEVHIMADYNLGDRTGKWFWDMIDSLGLSGMTNEQFDMYFVNGILYSFMEREYLPNGKGGLFTLKNPDQDMRNVEIWYQMCLYLRERQVS